MGGWPMDEHIAGGFWAKGQIPSKVRSFKGLYSIPYGCYCSKTISNLMMAGRNISASKLAMGSTRVMGNLCHWGRSCWNCGGKRCSVRLNSRGVRKAAHKTAAAGAAKE
ncbi:MAG: FAD-dependent oxidoreductase [Oscillospiraceae bacterium]